MIQLIISGEVSEEYVFFTDLYQRYQRLMYSVAKRYAASENEAEDIMQDAVERLLKRIPKLMELPGCTLPTYLVYTVRSTAVNFKRHQNVIEKHTLPIDYDDGNTYEEPSESPQEILERGRTAAPVCCYLGSNPAGRCGTALSQVHSPRKRRKARRNLSL